MVRGRVTGDGAADLLGVPRKSVMGMVTRGELSSHRHRRGGAFDVVDVVALAQRCSEVAATFERARVERESKQFLPPDDQHDWLSMPEVVAVLGVTRQAVGWWCQRDRIPFTWSCGARWVRRDPLELWVQARSTQSGRDL